MGSNQIIAQANNHMNTVLQREVEYLWLDEPAEGAKRNVNLALRAPAVKAWRNHKAIHVVCE